MRASGGTRVEWREIPRPVREQVDAACGSAVVSAENQPGGFSPGMAARCTLVDGRSVFIKAVSPDQNPQACRIHRREAEVAGQLPPTIPAPQLIATVDDGAWVALVFEAIDGRQPSEPWTLDDLDLVIPALLRFSVDVTPSPARSLQSVIDRHRPVFSGWRRLASGDGDVGDVGDWARSNLDRLARVEAGWESASDGDTLLHADLRADNLLIDTEEAVWIVDWPWACRGAAFVDLAFMLPSIGLGGGPTPADVVERFGLFTDVRRDDLLAVVTALAGFFMRASLDPPPPGLPTVRDFQRAQADVAVRWLQELLEDF